MQNKYKSGDVIITNYSGLSKESFTNIREIMKNERYYTIISNTSDSYYLRKGTSVEVAIINKNYIHRITRKLTKAELVLFMPLVHKES